MRTLEQIEKELQEAREALNHVQGTTTEVYSRIVGYYRSVRNWNRGKREEYGERKLFRVLPAEAYTAEIPRNALVQVDEPKRADENARLSKATAGELSRLVLFVRSACPACPPAKDAAHSLGIPVELVDADTEAGLSEASRRNVLSTPTAILLDPAGREIARARDAKSILAFAREMNLLQPAV
ncbi:MAG TPA: anaerobic ribonucleoside-triphosphate reductase [Treponema sp.]|jgi:ribonucleoside-triphosphate reductase|uniref:anaerobic ribonucleoside-triphosphate reductase n=1 Tax=Gracilinema caldarium TaxID=215591 RepID=UPI0026EB4264|nr:anaerobic ribonucleoside-triphosphate reductase [Gracilinema caldarium]HON13583.1 anaerobic ribonucleoside-triphosphate reductase [Treponema sp.]HPC70748.1 anaerobic ribonucleoside-triphosphate reductase [Treponema sp.]